MKRELTNQEAIALWHWAVENHGNNWGGWANYPVAGCSYLQFEDNPLVVKFDSTVTFQGESFKRIGWGRRIPGREASITFGQLYDLIPAELQPEKDVAPTYEFTHPNGNTFILKQMPYCDYKRHRFSVRFPDGKVREDFTKASNLFSQMLECKPEGIEIFY